MERLLAVLATALVGALVATQPPVNAQLARVTGALPAAFVSTTVSALAVGAVLVLSGQAGALGRLSGTPLIYLTGGLSGAALVTVSLITVRTLGATALVAATVSAQLIASAVLDRLGVLGLEQVGLTPARLVGCGLLVAGTLLVTLR